VFSNKGCALSRITNPLLMVVPAELLGSLVFAMIVIGGLMLVVGARQRGLALVGLAIAIPIISVIVEALMNDVFTMVPDSLVLPVAWLIMGVAYLMLLAAFVKMVFGEKAVDHAKGELLASAIKGVLRVIFWWPVMLTWMALVAYAVFFAR
jgi:hypothetical protein